MFFCKVPIRWTDPPNSAHNPISPRRNGRLEPFFSPLQNGRPVCFRHALPLPPHAGLLPSCPCSSRLQLLFHLQPPTIHPHHPVRSIWRPQWNLGVKLQHNQRNQHVISLVISWNLVLRWWRRGHPCRATIIFVDLVAASHMTDSDCSSSDYWLNTLGGLLNQVVV